MTAQDAPAPDANDGDGTAKTQSIPESVSPDLAEEAATPIGEDSTETQPPAEELSQPAASEPIEPTKTEPQENVDEKTSSSGEGKEETAPKSDTITAISAEDLAKSKKEFEQKAKTVGGISRELVFLIGIIAFALLFWYLTTDSKNRKRILGAVTTLFITGFCLFLFTPLSGVSLQKGIDLKGGSSFQVKIKPNDDGLVSQEAREQAKSILAKRLNPDGTKDITMTDQGQDSIIIQVPGISTSDRDTYRELISKTAKMDFYHVKPERRPEVLDAIEKDDIETLTKLGAIDTYFGTKVFPYVVTGDEKEDAGNPDRLLLSEVPDVRGDTVTRSWPMPEGLAWAISVELNGEGGKAMADFTAKHLRQGMAIVVDGEIVSHATINGIFSNSFQITGSFTQEQATQLATILENPLSNPLEIDDERSVDPTMGEATQQQGINAGLLGLGLTLLFVLFYYRLAGIVAMIGLAVNVCILFGAMIVFQQTLTMPGIAGILLTIGIAVDANVLIFERLREERKAGKSLGAAIDSAYQKAFSAIFDANITTLISSIILFIVASDVIKGFAVTLTIGILASMFAALLVTRVVFSFLTHQERIKNLSMAEIVKSDGIFDFLGKRKFATIVSLGMIALALGTLAFKNKSVLGVDFVGGQQIELRLLDGSDVTKEKVEKALAGLKYEVKIDGDEVEKRTVKEIFIQEQTSPDGRYVTIRSDSGSGEAIKKVLLSNFDDTKFILNEEAVGSSVAQHLLTNSMWAMALGLFGILLYITARFEFSFALGAVVALIHDLIIVAGIIALFDIKISLVLVGAFLTTAGYSINDTIVVFDRIRETLLQRSGSVLAIINEAINRTLGRTILTSATTLLTIGSLWIFGGPDLRDFSTTIILGVLVGTYSSIFVAAPVVYWWSQKTKRSLRREVLDAEMERLSREQSAGSDA